MQAAEKGVIRAGRETNGGEQPQGLVGGSVEQGERWGDLGGASAVRKGLCGPWLWGRTGGVEGPTEHSPGEGAAEEGSPDLSSAAGDTLQDRGAGRDAQSRVTPLEPGWGPRTPSHP